jgi:hypothetical protein
MEIYCQDCHGNYESLKVLKIPTKLIRLVKTTLTNSRAVVEVHQGRTEVFNINNGLRQGDALSTILFNLVLESALLKIVLRGTIVLELNNCVPMLTALS